MCAPSKKKCTRPPPPLISEEPSTWDACQYPPLITTLSTHVSYYAGLGCYFVGDLGCAPLGVELGLYSEQNIATTMATLVFSECKIDLAAFPSRPLQLAAGHCI